MKNLLLIFIYHLYLNYSKKETFLNIHFSLTITKSIFFTRSTARGFWSTDLIINSLSVIVAKLFKNVLLICHTFCMFESKCFDSEYYWDFSVSNMSCMILIKTIVSIRFLNALFRIPCVLVWLHFWFYAIVETILDCMAWYALFPMFLLIL